MGLAVALLHRRKSETKRPAGLHEPVSPVNYGHEADMLLTLPPASDFRTSLILPRLDRICTFSRLTYTFELIFL